MNIKLFKNFKLVANRLMLKGKKYAPEICIAAGIATAAAGVYLACKETLAVEGIIDEAKETLNDIQESEPTEEKTREYIDEDGEKKVYTKEIAARDKIALKVKTIAKLAKNYAPAALCLTASLIFTLGGFKILKKRHLALAASYAGLSESYKKYRKKIVDKYGKEADIASILGLSEAYKTVEKEDENGNRTVEEESEIKVEKKPGDDSDYTVLFSENTSFHHKKDSRMNYAFLKATESYANTLLHSKGHLFLNEVYDALGMKRTKTGALCGWVLNSEGDNFVDFGIRDWYGENGILNIEDAFGKSPSRLYNEFWLNFNCQGAIYDLI